MNQKLIKQLIVASVLVPVLCLLAFKPLNESRFKGDWIIKNIVCDNPPSLSINVVSFLNEDQSMRFNPSFTNWGLVCENLFDCALRIETSDKRYAVFNGVFEYEFYGKDGVSQLKLKNDSVTVILQEWSYRLPTF